MAHPLTQHPPPTIPFPSAPRPSPLGFGFGLPSTGSSLAFGSPSRSPIFPSQGSSSSTIGFGFASTTPNHAGPSGTFGATGSPKRNLARPGVSPSPSAFRSNTAPASSLKRTRRASSPTPSSSPSPSTSTLPSPAAALSDLPRKDKDDPLSVGSLALKDEGARRIVRKDVKRLRKELVVETSKGQTPTDADMDVGVLLAALSPTAHLPILMSLLSTHPSLVQEVLSKLPQPDQSECMGQLEKHVEKVKRHAGLTTIQVNPERVWTRVQKDVQEYITTASTYLTFFSSPSFTTTSYDPQIVQNLLHAMSTQIIYLLRLIPASSDVNAGTTASLLELGKRVISCWTSWLQALSVEINQHSGMYPHSTVEGWASNLDALVSAPDTSRQQPTFGWTVPQQPAESPHALVTSYRDAMKPIRDRFVNELGWLIGRHTSAMDHSTNTSWGR